MRYYKLLPEIAGEMGEGSELTYENGRIKEVLFLEYELMGWLGDELLSTHPCFIVTESLQNDIVSHGLTGVTFKQFSLTFSEEFYEFDGKEEDVPPFIQIVCEQSYEENIDNLCLDFYFNKYKEMIVSEKALRVIEKHTIENCRIEDYTSFHYKT